MVHTYHLTYQFTLYWDSFSRYADGYSLFLYHFMTPDSSTWQYFAVIGEEYKAFYEQLASRGYDVSCDFTISTTSDTFSFEFWSGGNFTGKYKTVVIGAGLDNPLSIS